MQDKVCFNVDISLIISVFVFFNHLNNETLAASVDILFFLCEDTVAENVIPMGNTATLNHKTPYIVFRRKGQVFLLLLKDHVLLDFFLKKIIITYNTFLYKQGRKISSSGNRMMCTEAVSQAFSANTCMCFKCHASVPFAFNLFNTQRFLCLRSGFTWTD